MFWLSDPIVGQFNRRRRQECKAQTNPSSHLRVEWKVDDVLNTCPNKRLFWTWLKPLCSPSGVDTPVRKKERFRIKTCLCLSLTDVVKPCFLIGREEFASDTLGQKIKKKKHIEQTYVIEIMYGGRQNEVRSGKNISCLRASLFLSRLGVIRNRSTQAVINGRCLVNASFLGMLSYDVESNHSCKALARFLGWIRITRKFISRAWS